MARQVRDWVPDQPIATGPLAWQAARRELQRRATPWWGTPLRIITGRRQAATRWAGDISRDAKSSRMADYAYAVQQAATRLNQVEEAELRQTGALPDWFFGVVEEERKADKRRPR